MFRFRRKIVLLVLAGSFLPGLMFLGLAEWLIGPGLIRAAWPIFLAVYLPAASLIALAGYYLTRKFTQPLESLQHNFQQAAAGNWQHRPQQSPGTEVGVLIRSFDGLLESLQEYRRAVEKEKASLRALLKQQTKEHLREKESQRAELQTVRQRLESIDQEKSREVQRAYETLEITLRNLKEAQVRLIQSEKLVALGNLAAGMAHEVNNPVGAIHAAADIAARAVREIGEELSRDQSTADLRHNPRFQHGLTILQDNTQLIFTASARVIRLLRSLRTFARSEEVPRQPTDVHAGIDSTLTLLQHEIKNRIAVEKMYGTVPAIPAHPDELNQVFLNLLSNSAQAIEGRGLIRIRTYADDRYLNIEIRDSGHGIPPEKVSKIFDPGFTTKKAGIGTGLGLSISYNIIRRHRGDIRVESEPGRGSTFLISLPLQQNRS